MTQHYWPRWGHDNIVDYVSSQRDAYKYLHDQTVRMMNNGLTGSEIAERLKLPDVLAKRWFIRGVDRNSFIDAVQGGHVNGGVSNDDARFLERFGSLFEAPGTGIPLAAPGSRWMENSDFGPRSLLNTPAYCGQASYRLPLYWRRPYALLKESG